jgi:hypothetical protein
MQRECRDDRHVFHDVAPETWGSGSLTIKVDSDGQARCYCGKLTLTQFSSPPSMCADCEHPKPHHLNGWCYGPVEYDMDDCQCRQYVPKPEQMPVGRRIVV